MKPCNFDYLGSQISQYPFKILIDSKTNLFPLSYFIFSFEKVEQEGAEGKIHEDHDPDQEEPRIFLMKMDPSKATNL